MDRVKPEYIIISIIISYTVAAFAATTHELPMWIAGLSFSGICTLFFQIILRESNNLMEDRFRNNKGVYYLILYIFFTVLTLFFIVHGLWSLRSYGKAK